MSKSEVDNLKEAEKVLWWYPQPNSLIDEGNLYFAAIEYQSAYQALQKENEELKTALSEIKSYRWCPHCHNEVSRDIATEALKKD